MRGLALELEVRGYRRTSLLEWEITILHQLFINSEILVQEDAKDDTLNLKPKRKSSQVIYY